MKTYSELQRRAAGVALFLLRGSAAALLVSEQAQCFLVPPHVTVFITFALAVLLLIGFVTPVAGLAAVLEQACYLLATPGSPTLVGIVTIVICLSLGSLGAGAYSLDGVLYGRRRIIL